MAAMNDQVGAVQRGIEEFLVALELECVRHYAIRVRQHAVGGDDDVALDAQRRHNRA